MKFVEQIERLQYLDKLIRKKSTGTPNELAGRLGISRSQLYNLISYFNDIGMEIKYSRLSKSFYYKNKDKRIEINFSIVIVTDREQYRIYGNGIPYQQKCSS